MPWLFPNSFREALMGAATVFAPGSIGNVGPGFDTLGLAVDGLGDEVTVSLLSSGPSVVEEVSGLDAEAVPRDPEKNVASVAALAYLRESGSADHVALRLHKGLPFEGGLGGSAASSVGGALAAALALGHEPRLDRLLRAAARGEEMATGSRHLDNLAPCILGGLALVRSNDPMDVLGLPVEADWWLALVTPAIRIGTREARKLLPEQWERDAWIQQMANTSALVAAFMAGDAALARRALHDGYAEPRRAHLIPHFAEVKAAALGAGAIGCSISGAGPTLFALLEDAESARLCVLAMRAAFQDVRTTGHAARIAREGARAL